MRRVAVLVFLAVVACKKEPTVEIAGAPVAATDEATAKDDPRVATAAAAIDEMRKNLKATLQTAVAEKGVVAAIDVCKIEAPKLAEGASDGEVRVGRTALKLRNPNNASEEWVRPILQELAKTPTRTDEPHVLIQEDGSLAYAEPIYTEALCLLCHGAAIAPEVAAAIDTAYPTDQAKGFAPDQFRGVFWAVVPKSK